MYESSQIVSSMNIFIMMKTSPLGTKRMNSLIIDVRAKKHIFCLNFSCLYPSFCLSYPLPSPNETLLLNIFVFLLCVIHCFFLKYDWKLCTGVKAIYQ